jgi:hypothetical protein
VGPVENFIKREEEEKGRGGEGRGRAPQFVWSRAPKYFNPTLDGPDKDREH